MLTERMHLRFDLSVPNGSELTRSHNCSMFTTLKRGRQLLQTREIRIINAKQFDCLAICLPTYISQLIHILRFFNTLFATAIDMLKIAIVDLVV